jgi:beta-galactosidase
VVIDIVDKDGLPVPDANNEVTVEINGPLKLSGLESGALNSMEDYRSLTKKVFNGKLLAYISSQGKAGVSKVTFRSHGVKSCTLLIRTLTAAR